MYPFLGFDDDSTKASNILDQPADGINISSLSYAHANLQTMREPLLMLDLHSPALAICWSFSVS
jgi:hypothetical protein